MSEFILYSSRSIKISDNKITWKKYDLEKELFAAERL